MLNTLIQTIANLGFDSQAITDAFNSVIETLRNGDMSSVRGVSDVFTGIIAALTGTTAGDINAMISSLTDSVIAILSDDATSSVLSIITGA